MRCGPGVRGVGWPDAPHTRAVTLLGFTNLVHERSARLCATGVTAAWIWGASWHSDHPIEFSTLHGKRFLSASPRSARVREYNITEQHVRPIAGVLVTTPSRTLYDLLYLDADEYESHGLVAARELIEARLLPHTQMGLAHLTVSFHSRNRPYRVRADARLAELEHMVAR